MIPEAYLIQWRQQAPWRSLLMVEQDLILSRALIDLYSQSEVSDSLAFRGGTALNKLFLTPPARYSEDLDFVQIRSEPIGKVLTAIRTALDSWLGEPKRKITERSVKLFYRYEAIDGSVGKIKLEINTTEHFQVEPLQYLPISVNSPWFNGQTSLVTYRLNELMGTKLRALYQRRKGRDLFDLWLMLDRQLIDPETVISIFQRYSEHNDEHVTRALFEKSLHYKKQHPDFIGDMTPLLADPQVWDFDKALSLVQEHLVSKLPGNAWKEIKQ